MAKVTERSLKDACHQANMGVLKNWSFGLKAERYGKGFMLYRLFRRAGNGQAPMFSEPMAAKETHCFIQGFLDAAALANGGEGAHDSPGV